MKKILVSLSLSLQEMLTSAQRIFDQVNSSGKSFPVSADHASYLDEEAESMRWFLLPNEAQQALSGQTTPISTPPFHPRVYLSMTMSPKCSNSSKSNTRPSGAESCQDSCKERNVVDGGLSDETVSREKGSKEKPKEREKKEVIKFRCPPKNIYKPTTEVRVHIVHV